MKVKELKGVFARIYFNVRESEIYRNKEACERGRVESERVSTSEREREEGVEYFKVY
jgi:hypothetical protein